jgi:hypothetical protein
MEQWTQMNRPSARLTKAAPTNAPRGVIKPTRLQGVVIVVGVVVRIVVVVCVVVVVVWGVRVRGVVRSYRCGCCGGGGLRWERGAR